MKNNLIGKTAYVKFGTFHGQLGTILSEVHVNGHERFMIRLKNGMIIPKKQKNVVIFEGVQSNDSHKKK
jgi:predicted metalloenzyme YecM